MINIGSRAVDGKVDLAGQPAAGPPEGFFQGP